GEAILVRMTSSGFRTITDDRVLGFSIQKFWNLQFPIWIEGLAGLAQLPLLLAVRTDAAIIRQSSWFSATIPTIFSLGIKQHSAISSSQTAVSFSSFKTIRSL